MAETKPAAPAPAAEVVETKSAAEKFVYTSVKHVEVSLLKLVKDTDYFVRFTGPIYLGEKLAQATDKKDPAYLINIIDLKTARVHRMIVPQILRESLDKNYPKNAYVEKCFRVRLVIPPEKRYNLVELEEITVPAKAAA